jgi:putative transposase
MCQALKVSRSNYYYWKNNQQSKTTVENELLEKELKSIFVQSRKNYGIKRLKAELEVKGLKVGHNRIAKIKQENNIYPKIKRKHKVTTDSNHSNRVSPNLLNRDFNAAKPYEKLVSDITYISTLEGWLYLATVIDLHNRKVIGWSMSETLESEIVTESLKMAFIGKGKAKGCIFHSDRGSQYTSDDVRNLIEELELSQSMSRKANCWDNSVAESFFKTLKYEGDAKRVFNTRQEAKLSIFEFIEVFYNRKRRHSSLGYLTPDEFELLYLKQIA